MRKLLTPLLLALFLCPPVQATKKVFLRNSACQVDRSSQDYLTKLADGTQGTVSSTAVTNTIVQSDASFVGQYWPVSTTGWIITSTAGGTRVVWLSAPLSAGFTIVGTITPNIYGQESNNAANSGIRYEVLRWNSETGGISSSLGISGETTEWSTSSTVRTTPTLTPTSTAFNTGDRLMIVIYNTAVGGDQTASSRTMTITYDGLTAVSGDTYLLFDETLTFAGETNNAPPQGFSSEYDGRARLFRMFVSAIN
jgi:hypothetical protein